MHKSGNALGKTLAIGLALAVALPPSALALAQGGPRVALVPLESLFTSVPQSVADRVSELLSRELRRQDGVHLVPLVSRGEAAPGRAVAPATSSGGDAGGEGATPSGPAPFQGQGERGVARGQAQIAKGKKDMARLKFDAAAQELRDGIAQLEGSFDVLSDFGTLGDAYLQLAIAELRLGHKPQGQDALAAVARLQPDRTLSGPYPAVFTRLYATIKEQQGVAVKGTLAVSSTPAGQAISVDGREVGATPLALDLVPGTHFAVIGGGVGKLAYKIEVTAGATVSVGTGEAPVHHVVRQPQDTLSRTDDLPPPALAGIDPLIRLRGEVTQNDINADGAQALLQLARSSGANAIVFGALHYIDDEQSLLGLDCLVYSLAHGEVAALTRVQFDADLTGAPVEILKVTAEVAQKLSHWADVVSLPSPVSPDAKVPTVAGKKPVAAPIGAKEARRDEGDELVAASHSRKVDAVETASDFGPPPDAQTTKSDGFPWAPVGIGVGIGVAVGVGVVVLVMILNQKAGSTPRVTW